MNELIKTLQVWSENPTNIHPQCNLPTGRYNCYKIDCTECPMNVDKNGPREVTIKSLGEFNERTNKNIKPIVR